MKFISDGEPISDTDMMPGMYLVIGPAMFNKFKSNPELVPSEFKHITFIETGYLPHD